METTADFLIKRLAEWGVKTIFGYPGDGINGIMGALDRHCDLIQFVQVRHEEMAAFMACAYAKFTGELGVCLATSGPGAIHLLNGLYDAKMDKQPVLAIVGQTQRSALGSDYQQEVNLSVLMQDVAHEFNHLVTLPVQLRHLLDRAIRIAKAEKTVTSLIIPKDIQEAPAEPSPERKHGSTFSGLSYQEPKVVPYPSDLQHAADILNAGQKVAILVGAGARHAGAEVEQVAQLLGAGVAKALLGKDVLPDDLPFVTGSIGLLGTQPSWDMINQCDTFFMIGSSFPYAEFLPKEGQARGVQIDIKASQLSLRYPMEVNLVGDTRQTLQALMPLLQEKTDRSWQTDIQQNIRDWWDLLKRRSDNTADPVNPQRVFWALSQCLPEDIIITCDTGTATFWYARDIQIKRGMRASLSGTLATMGCGVPYAIGAKFAYPNRPVIALVGDGAMQMNGSAELLTVVRYYPQWADPRLIILVLNNQDLNFVTWEMRVMSGNPKFNASQDLPAFSYSQYAQAIGLEGVSIHTPEDIEPALERAFQAQKPIVVEAFVDPTVPPLPPHITLDQAKAMSLALLKGDSERLGIIRATVKDLLDAITVK